MTVSDPILKSIKYLVQEFHSVGQEITDRSPYLEQLCITIEQCFLKGIKTDSWKIHKNKESVRRKRFWLILRSFETNGPMPYTITTAVNKAVENRKLKTADGRMRYLFRHCLRHKSLHVLVEFLMSRKESLKEWYYENQNSGKKAMTEMTSYGGGNSIIIHEQLAEQLRSLLLTCSASLNFNLDLKNTYFLDESWQIPITNTMEFVPSNELGIQMLYIDGFAIVTDIKTGSLAAEKDELSVGDLLVEMNGHILFPALRSGENDVLSVWRQCKRRNLPCKLTVLKSRVPGTGKIYLPLSNAFKEYEKWMESHYKGQQEKIDRQCDEEERDAFAPTKANERTPVLEPHAAQEGVGGKFLLQYVGEVETGDDGSVDQIEVVVRQGMKKANERTMMNVELTITQISVQTSLIHDDKQLLFNHKYADISSCGKIKSDELHFCYIAGDTFCTISKLFKGYVFRASSQAQAKIILNAIYQGFKRTTWFM